MFYLPEQDLVFVHIPRTGGKSLKTFLENYGTNTDIEIFDKHSPVSTACHFMDNPDALFKCSIVRNPYSREVSLWRAGINGPLAGSDMNFDTWVNWRYNGRPKDISNLLTYLDPVTVTSLWGLNKCPQVFYLIDSSTSPRIDYIGSYENFDNIFTMMKKRFHEKYSYVKHVAMKNPIPWERKLNKSEMDWRLMYQQSSDRDNLLKSIGDFYHWDFETFGYNKDWMAEDDGPSRNIGEFPKPSSDAYDSMMNDWPLKQFFGERPLPLLHDGLSYSYMPDGANRSVYLRNTIKLKVNDVVMRDDS